MRDAEGASFLLATASTGLAILAAACPPVAIPALVLACFLSVGAYALIDGRR